MCRVIALRIRPWLGRTQIQLYISIIGMRWLYLNFELVFTVIQMGSDDNWSDVVMCPKPVKSTYYIKIDLAICLCARH
jgi:hypothetical protein